jgi:hypothetical protein
MIQRVVLPASIQAFVDTQPTLPLDDADQASEARPYPYSEYWRRAIAGMLLSGRVKPKIDGAPNMTDVNRIGKAANFNQYLFERTAKFFVAAHIISVSRGKREYVPGEYAEAYWHRDLKSLQPALRRAFLAFFQQFTGHRPTVAFSSQLDIFATLFASAFTGLSLPEEQMGTILHAFSQLPERDLEQLAQTLGFTGEPLSTASWHSGLDAKSQDAFVSALAMCDWAYAHEARDQRWLYFSDQARIMLGLDEPPPLPPLATEFNALPNLCVFAGADLPPETLVPLFRYCKIQRIDRVLEFQLDKKQFTETPSNASTQHELATALQALKPLPATIESFLNTKPMVSGEIRIRGCSAIVKPENREVLEVIREHRRLKGYLEAGAPDGYLLIKPRSDPYQFVKRCQELGFTVATL